MSLHNPPHPGETLREDVLPVLGLSITAFAKHLGYARETLSRVINGHASVSPDLAIRLEMTGIGSARVWLSVQTDYDLWQARQQAHPAVSRLYDVA